ncbi:hypothetical protein A1O1_03812 [Capronia coronata CBS 617.96]|uniref:Major facilitator superfamily (MFS) profile domain-containing protein n=1 Tax=Capronia coronata CBS 617.96 TaxID=1182541 RepID=W9YDU1_9EURO|nr:uncharacterized protein A1O1_03812 [Capronia coronata CBS 617.96]EXJ90708.1 hypothetical protein A1O1_03812 [Capronia coronata CBS 617.96]
MKTYRERLALVTTTRGSILRDFYQPVILLFSFPAITYAAITYGSLLAGFALMTSVQATYLFYPPYNFSAAGVGLMNVAPFVGTIPVTFFAGYLDDKSIMWLASRNGGCLGDDIDDKDENWLGENAARGSSPVVEDRL